MRNGMVNSPLACFLECHIWLAGGEVQRRYVKLTSWVTWI